MEYIQRNSYLQKLIDRKDNGLIKIITGIRRCGKSYLLFTLHKDYLLSIGIKKQILFLSIWMMKTIRNIQQRASMLR
ncbi:MAG TPA: hypothetical protein DCS37_04170 [Clostridiales bacterium]|nr:hypothetical protein [Clostridiales bacterium]